MSSQVRFKKPGRLIDDDLELVCVQKVSADPVHGFAARYEFEMRRPGRSRPLGVIRLRIGSIATVRYNGHIGYEVKKHCRGHRYAARSCRLLMPLARAHGVKALWLTMDPKNIPSQKTCEFIGAKYIDTVRIPKSHGMYQDGARYVRRYRLRVTRVEPISGSDGKSRKDE